MTIRQTAEHTGIYKITRSTGEGFADTIALMKQFSEARQREKTAWLDDAERYLKAILDSPDARPTIRSDAEAAWGTLGMVRASLARGAACTVEAGFWFYRLGQEVEKLAVRPFELLVDKGRRLVCWHGRTCAVTKREHDILTCFADRRDVPLVEVVRRAWKTAYEPDLRTKYDMAFSRLTTKLFAAGILIALHVRAERVVFEETPSP